MTTIDIVNLVENNPITKLSKSYNNKLLNKLKSEFTEQHQQLFVASFYCYLNYNQSTDFVIDLDNVWGWLGFSQKFTAKRVLEKNFVIDKDYKISLHNLVERDNVHGGQNKETILLTVKTFKLFCIKAGTKKAGEIHEYFVKLEEILQQTLHDETDELKNQLEEQKAVFENKLTKTKELERHNILLREFSYSTEVVYIIRVKTFENGSYIVKIGESRRGVEGRYKEHRSKYEEAVILDCFSVKKSREFEQFLHNHEKIKSSRYTKLPNHENELELFLIGEHLTYKMLLQVIEENVIKFNEYNSVDFEKIKIENELLQQKLAAATTSQQQPQTQENVSELKTYIMALEQRQIEQDKKLDAILEINRQILEKLASAPAPKPTTGFGELKRTIGPRLQQINPETLTLIKVYDYVEEAINESNNRLKRPSIEKSVREATVYQGFRWNYVSRDKDPTIIENLAPTKKTKTQILGYVAKLDAEKSTILNVYIDRKTAAIENGYKTAEALANPLKKGTQSRGHCYMYYETCNDSLKAAFMGGNKIVLYKDGVGKFNESGELVCEYICKYDCITSEKMSDKTMAKILDKQCAYNGFYYRKIGSKIKL